MLICCFNSFFAVGFLHATITPKESHERSGISFVHLLRRTAVQPCARPHNRLSGWNSSTHFNKCDTWDIHDVHCNQIMHADHVLRAAPYTITLHNCCCSRWCGPVRPKKKVEKITKQSASLRPFLCTFFLWVMVNVMEDEVNKTNDKRHSGSNNNNKNKTRHLKSHFVSYRNSCLCWNDSFFSESVYHFRLWLDVVHWISVLLVRRSAFGWKTDQNSLDFSSVLCALAAFIAKMTH